MAIGQKMRSLHCGLQAGLNFSYLEGDERGILLNDIPFELEKIVENWILVLPENMQSMVLFMKGGQPEALTEVGWSSFVAWMTDALQHAQRQADFQESAQTAMRARTD